MLRTREIGQISSVYVAETLYEIIQQFMVKANLNKAGIVMALIDSGSAGNFIHEKVVKEMKLPTIARKTPLRVTHVKGGQVGMVHTQVKCYLRIRDMDENSHREIITLDIAPIGRHQVILGLPWLKAHQPELDWGGLKLRFNQEHCREQCLLGQGIGIACISMEEIEVMEIKAQEEVTDWKQLVPKEYHNYSDVFNLEKARKLPPLQEGWDFKIKLIKDAPLPPRSRPYRLTPDQIEEAGKQLKELEEMGMIEDSSSPIAAPLFFIPKKDGTQRMVIDYRKLNDITVKDAYPLPNMEELLEVARGAKVFSKFDSNSPTTSSELSQGTNGRLCSLHHGDLSSSQYFTMALPMHQHVSRDMSTMP